MDPKFVIYFRSNLIPCSDQSKMEEKWLSWETPATQTEWLALLSNWSWKVEISFLCNSLLQMQWCFDTRGYSRKWNAWECTGKGPLHTWYGCHFCKLNQGKNAHFDARQPKVSTLREGCCMFSAQMYDTSIDFYAICSAGWTCSGHFTSRSTIKTDRTGKWALHCDISSWFPRGTCYKVCCLNYKILYKNTFIEINWSHRFWLENETIIEYLIYFDTSKRIS